MKKISVTIEPESYEVREEMRSLRTNLLFCGDDKKVIFVTSAIASEGKTEVVIRLAYALAELKKRILVVDTDFRKSVMTARVSALQTDGGLSHFLSGQMELTDVIYATDVSGMHIMFAGPSVPNPTELLSGQRFSKMLASLKERYDYILIDTPPVGLVVDGLVIAKECDGSIFVLESGKIKRTFAFDVKRKLENTGCPILGVVLNKVDRKKTVGYYGRYYGRRYDKYYGSERETMENK